MTPEHRKGARDSFREGTTLARTVSEETKKSGRPWPETFTLFKLIAAAACAAVAKADTREEFLEMCAAGWDLAKGLLPSDDWREKGAN